MNLAADSGKERRNASGMPSITRLIYLLTLVTAGLCASSAAALTIDLDFDTSSVFYTNPTARAAIQQAADDISDAITSSMSSINQSTSYIASAGTRQYVWEKTRTSGNQSLTAKYGWNYQYTEAGTPVSISAETLPSHTVQIHVHGENLSGSNLGRGGPAGYSLSRSYSASGNITQSTLNNLFDPLTDQISSLVQGEMTRGSGPVIGTLSGNTGIDFGNGLSATADYSISYGPAYGSLALDTSYGSTSFTNYWHLDHTTSVVGNKRDLYSVALHEMLHAIGVGASETWNELIVGNGTAWSGAEVFAETGVTNNMVVKSSGSDSDYADHIAYGKSGRNIYTGATQEAVMDPDLTNGSRKYLTTLDLAFLRDLGYTTITPEFGLPGDFNDDGLVDMADYVVWRNNLGSANEAALHYNGNGGGIAAADYTLWKNNFGVSQGALSSQFSPAAVPEPAALSLAALFFLGLAHCLLKGKP